MYPVPGYPYLQTDRPQGTNLAGGQVDVADVQPAELSLVNRVGQALHQVVTIFSGYRTDAYSQAVGGFAGDPHSRRIAVDANIGGTPIGNYPGAVALIHRYGGRSGATDFQYNGRPDPAHVDILGQGAAHPKGSSWEDMVLASLHAPLSGYNEQFLRAWETREGGVTVEHINNPLNTTLDRAKYPGYPGAPAIPVYPNLKVGADETARTIEAGFPGILHALRADEIGTALGSPSVLSDLNKWVTGQRNPNPTDYTRGVAQAYAKSGAGEASASDWTSYDIKDLKNDVGGLTNPLYKFLREWFIRGGMILLGTGLALVGLYLIARSFGGPSIGVADKVTTIATRGAVKPGASKTPRRAGDAAAARGEEVARTGPPEAPTARDRRNLRANARSRERAAQSAAAKRDAAYGGDDDIPF